MKRYIKDNEIKTSKQIIIYKNGKQIINPTEEMILDNGWVEYIDPVCERTIEDCRRDKKEEVLYFYSSEEIKSFYIQGVPVWFDKTDRVGLKLRFEAELEMGKTDTILWHNSIQFPLSLKQAMQMLYTIEVYASTCYDNTQKHLIEIDKLETVEEINDYNYKIDYPNKLEF